MPPNNIQRTHAKTHLNKTVFSPQQQNVSVCVQLVAISRSLRAAIVPASTTVCCSLSSISLSSYRYTPPQSIHLHTAELSFDRNNNEIEVKNRFLSLTFHPFWINIMHTNLQLICKSLVLIMWRYLGKVMYGNSNRWKWKKKSCVFLPDYAIWPPNRQHHRRCRVENVRAQNGYNAAQPIFVKSSFADAFMYLPTKMVIIWMAIFYRVEVRENVKKFLDRCARWTSVLPTFVKHGRRNHQCAQTTKYTKSTHQRAGNCKECFWAKKWKCALGIVLLGRFACCCRFRHNGSFTKYHNIACWRKHGGYRTWKFFGTLEWKQSSGWR